MIKRNLLIIGGAICILFIIFFVIFRNSSESYITLIYHDEKEIEQHILIRKSKYLDVFEDMKRSMRLENKDYEDDYGIIYGHNIEIIEKKEDYFERYLIYGTKVIYIKSLYDLHGSEKNKVKTINSSELERITIPNLESNEENLQISLYSVDELYFKFFLDVYQKLKK